MTMVRMKRYGRKFVRRTKRNAGGDIGVEESSYWRDFIGAREENKESVGVDEKVKIVVDEDENTIFNDRELKLMEGYEEGEDHIKVLCGCTNKKYGDFDGQLRITSSGQFLIDCKCFSDCDQVKLTPDEFEKHSMREGAKKWQEHIWVILGDDKVPVGKTAVQKYYKHAANVVNDAAIARRRRKVHRDEFIKCTACGKDKRFILRTQDQFRAYHQALSLSLANSNSNSNSWNCLNHPDGLECHSKKERECKKAYQVCPRTRTCKGCQKCVCMGCFTCRLRDCHCRDCLDFFANAPAYI